MHRNLAAVSAAILLLVLTGCSSTSTGTVETAAPGASTEAEAPVEPAEPLDLAGEWKQTNSASETAYQAATIADGEITVNWVNEETSTTSLYWVGTYEAPTEATDTFQWDSENDHSQTDNALMASEDDTKTFTFEGGVLKYEVTALGTTQTVELAPQQ